jgi:hypothetical protein
MTSLEELFCHIDNFCQAFAPQWQATLLGQGLKQMTANLFLTG